MEKSSLEFFFVLWALMLLCINVPMKVSDALELEFQTAVSYRVSAGNWARVPSSRGGKAASALNRGVFSLGLWEEFLSLWNLL